MANPAHVSRVRSLYKRLLMLHRFMPIELRALGDQYVKDEFRRHKTASGHEVATFMVEWEKYRDTLQAQVLQCPGDEVKRGQFGTDLAEEKLKHFQDEQIGQLHELMLESTKPSRQFDVQSDRPQN
ncbi:succinate dehydrogenase assembly factor 3, mitochondrial [Denticeps clupeoides]|uniref:Succinate dehydrogenase assembly factor 3 n=1 Tax=Denticeps clupeoides TaxID=299321 RepID=A0AAY4EPH2_9TELE|nr:succinate dehydrogenase assembly factor 3, mitochondrial [Denticeps clupeoides]